MHDGLSGDLLRAEENHVRPSTGVPDNVLTPLIKRATSDNYFISVCAMRDDEAIGMVAGAWMGGMRGYVKMQTSGSGNAGRAVMTGEVRSDDAASRRTALSADAVTGAPNLANLSVILSSIAVANIVFSEVIACQLHVPVLRSQSKG
jgi:hypothetical protein